MNNNQLGYNLVKIILYTYLDIDIVLVDICEDTVLAIVSLVAPDFASLIGPGPVLGLFVIVPVIVVPVIIVVVPVVCVPVVCVPVVARLDSFDLIVRSEGIGRFAALLCAKGTIR